MKMHRTLKTLCGLLCCILLSFIMTSNTQADGIDALGPPEEITIAPGSHILVEGVGLIDAQPGEIFIEIPAGQSIAQVLLYWNGWGVSPDGTIEVDGIEVTGKLIGTPDPTFRADITAFNWVVSGAVNVLSIGGLEYGGHDNGAAVVVILDDGSVSNMEILDGSDLAFLPTNSETVPVDFTHAPSSEPRLGTLWLIVSDIEVPRPSGVQITVGGVTEVFDDVFLNNEGDYLDVVELEVLIPAGVTDVTVQVLSMNDNIQLPASLCWNFVAWVVPEEIVTTSGGCTYTIGYWKNHPENWPTDTLSLFTGDEAMNILWSPPKGGNAFLILAHQYIAAELNMNNGASMPFEVLHALGTAQALLEIYLDAGTIPKNASDRNLAIATAGVLDAYNNGLLGPGHCDEKDPCVKEDPCVEEEPCVKQEDVYVKKDVKTQTKSKSKK